MFFGHFSFTLTPTPEIVRDWGPSGLSGYSMEIMRKPVSRVTIHLGPESIQLWSTHDGNRASFRLYDAKLKSPVLLDINFYNLRDFNLRPESTKIVEEVLRTLDNSPHDIHPALRKTTAIPGYRRVDRSMGKCKTFELATDHELIVCEDVNLESLARLRNIGMDTLRWLYQHEQKISEIEK